MVKVFEKTFGTVHSSTHLKRTPYITPKKENPKPDFIHLGINKKQGKLRRTLRQEVANAERTVTAALRVMGLNGEKHFQNYHRVFNRAIWSSLEAGHILLGLLISAFASSGPIIMGLDDTIERRRGAKIKAKGIYRDPVRSSHSHFVKASGLRWQSLMLLTPIPWAKRVWALPFLTVLAPSERYYKDKLRKHKKLTEWAHKMVLQVCRWLPKRLLVVVADSSFAIIDLLWQLDQLKNPICMITRFRLDAALYEPNKPMPGKMGRPRKKGKRLPSLEKIAEAKLTRWKYLTMQEWYGEKKRDIEITSKTAVWFHSEKPPLPIRWVIVRNPKKVFKTQALLCADINVSAIVAYPNFHLLFHLIINNSCYAVSF